MKVNKIDLSEPRFEPDTSLHKATVTLNVTGASGVPFELTFSCETAQPEDCPSTLVLYGLIKHAMKQARILPAFRGSDSELRLDLEQVTIAAA